MRNQHGPKVQSTLHTKMCNSGHILDKSRASPPKSPFGLDYRDHVSPITALQRRTLNAYLKPCSENFRDAKEMDDFLNKHFQIKMDDVVGIIQLNKSVKIRSGQGPTCTNVYLCQKGISRPGTPYDSRAPTQRTFFISALDMDEKAAWLLEITHQCPGQAFRVTNLSPKLEHSSRSLVDDFCLGAWIL